MTQEEVTKMETIQMTPFAAFAFSLLGTTAGFTAMTLAMAWVARFNAKKLEAEVRTATNKHIEAVKAASDNRALKFDRFVAATEAESTSGEAEVV